MELAELALVEALMEEAALVAIACLTQSHLRAAVAVVATRLLRLAAQAAAAVVATKLGVGLVLGMDQRYKAKTAGSPVWTKVEVVEVAAAVVQVRSEAMRRVAKAA